MDGVLNIYKPQGMTSHDVVSKIRRIYGQKRVGHAGTLDPMATGVLPVLVGTAAAAQDYLMEHEKQYRAGMRFGILTDTGDITGTILKTTECNFSEGEIRNAAARYVGTIEQIPPMYSAIKIGGKKLYELAREGISVERKAREITISSIAFKQKTTDTDYVFDVFCSKGTYIRTLCEDIGTSLGCGATLFSLERRSVGRFHVENSVTIETLEQIKNSEHPENLEQYLLSTETIFEKHPAVTLSEFYARLSKNGAEIYLEKAKIDENLFQDGTWCRLYDHNGKFYALGELCSFENGKAIKARVRFDTERK
jgi:tRNA pseudouridine 55 synthase